MPLGCIGIPPDILTQMTMLDELLGGMFKMPTLICIVAMFFVEAAIVSGVPRPVCRLHLWGPLEVMPPLDFI